VPTLISGSDDDSDTDSDEEGDGKHFKALHGKAEGAQVVCMGGDGKPFAVGLCRLNQVDPCPIAYSLSNP
jgi:hypothetical protein